MRRGWTVLSAVTVMMLALAWTSPAAACSGGSDVSVVRAADDSENADLVIHGVIHALDDSAMNAIVRVKRGLNGVAPPSYVALRQNTPQGVIADRDYRTGWGCGPQAQPFDLGFDVVLFLNRTASGVYNIAFYPHRITARFEDRNVKNAFHIARTASDPPQTMYLNRDELISLILSAPGMGELQPYDVELPRLNPLLIATDRGSLYVLPVDRDEPVRLTRFDVYAGSLAYPSVVCVDCSTLSPAEYDQPATVDHWPYVGVMRRDSRAAGQHPSQLDVAYARWVEEEGQFRIDVALPLLQTYAALPAGVTARLEPYSVAVRYEQALEALVNKGAWSPDGRMFAYTDADGVWLWDVYIEPAMPRKLAFDADHVYQFSQTGRFLRIGLGGVRTWVDLVTGDRLPDGVFSPDDRLFIGYDQPVQIRHLVPQLFPTTSPIPIGNAIVHEAVWFDRHHVALLMCIDNQRPTCAIVDWTFTTDQYMRDTTRPVPYEGYAFDVSADTGSLAVAEHDQSIMIRDGVTGEHRWFSVRSHLDGDISAIEWAPSVFYYGYVEGAHPVRR